jgi:hypothetical protein
MNARRYAIRSYAPRLKNMLYFGDNLGILRAHIANESYEDFAKTL